MQGEVISKVLLDEATIQNRVAELGDTITASIKNKASMRLSLSVF